MAEKSFTLIEPHFHGDLSIGPTTINEPSNDAKESPAETGGRGPLIMLLVALVAIGAAIAIAKSLGEE